MEKTRLSGITMTIRDVIDALSQYPADMDVYVPDFNQTLQIAKRVESFQHLNTPPGISISDDVWILPWEDPSEALDTEASDAV
jgi:hypothetical protein